jgi:hypothetical protein
MHRTGLQLNPTLVVDKIVFSKKVQELVEYVWASVVIHTVLFCYLHM